VANGGLSKTMLEEDPLPGVHKQSVMMVSHMSPPMLSKQQSAGLSHERRTPSQTVHFYQQNTVSPLPNKFRNQSNNDFLMQNPNSRHKIEENCYQQEPKPKWGTNTEMNQN
jgi:hypothetical protein